MKHRTVIRSARWAVATLGIGVLVAGLGATPAAAIPAQPPPANAIVPNAREPAASVTTMPEISVLVAAL